MHWHAAPSVGSVIGIIVTTMLEFDFAYQRGGFTQKASAAQSRFIAKTADDYQALLAATRIGSVKSSMAIQLTRSTVISRFNRSSLDPTTTRLFFASTCTT